MSNKSESTTMAKVTHCFHDILTNSLKPLVFKDIGDVVMFNDATISVAASKVGEQRVHQKQYYRSDEAEHEPSY